MEIKLLGFNPEWRSNRDYILDLRKDFISDDAYAKFLAKNSGRFDLKKCWDQLNNLIGLIQIHLTRGRICHVCGEICRNRLISHLEKHNQTTQDWFDATYGIDRSKVHCKQCGKYLGDRFNLTQYYYPDFCSLSCRSTHQNARLGDNRIPYAWTDEQLKARGMTRDDPRYLELLRKRSELSSKTAKSTVKTYGWNFTPTAWTDEQLKARGYSGKDDPRYLKLIKEYIEFHQEVGSQSYLSQIKSGTYMFTYNGNPEHDKIVRQVRSKVARKRIDSGTSICGSYNGNPEHDKWLYEIKSKATATKIKNGSLKLLSTYKINIKLNGKLFYVRSSWELYVIAYLILIVGVNPSDIIYEPNINNKYPDLYIKSLDMYIEIHPENTIYEKKLIYDKFGIDIEYWSDDLIYEIKSELYQLHDQRFPLWKYDEKIVDIYSDSFRYDFDELERVA